ncbi:hypothetical protein, partial [Salinibacter ruber]|uniref:hypothetical protein n=1 Tax=Salinibacter ruber TaxID=146919 RepID=UPI00216AA2FF
FVPGVCPLARRKQERPRIHERNGHVLTGSVSFSTTACKGTIPMPKDSETNEGTTATTQTSTDGTPGSAQTDTEGTNATRGGAEDGTSAVNSQDDN